jgi:hypothetical protein
MMIEYCDDVAKVKIKIGEDTNIRRIIKILFLPRFKLEKTKKRRKVDKMPKTNGTTLEANSNGITKDETARTK